MMAKPKQVRKPPTAPVRIRRAKAPAPETAEVFAPESTWQAGKLLAPVDEQARRLQSGEAPAPVPPRPPRGAAEEPPAMTAERPTPSTVAALLAANPLPRGRFAPRRPAIRPGPLADDIFAEFNGDLVQYRLENGTTLRKIETVIDAENLVQSSIAYVPLTASTFAIYFVMESERQLVPLVYTQTGAGVPTKTDGFGIDVPGGFLGDPVVLPGPTGNANVVARLAIRITGGVIIYDVAKDGNLKPTCGGRAVLSIAEVHGRIAGLCDPIANVFVPQSPIKNGFVNTGNANYGERLLPAGPGEPNGDMCVISTSVPKTMFHVFVPSGQRTLYFRGADTWVVEEIPFRLDGMAAERVTPSRTVVLGRMGQQLFGFSFDVASDGKVKLNLSAPPFAQAITGDPVLFRGYAPDGDVHLAAIVYAEVNKLLYLWYDHGTDGWSLLPP